MASAWLGSLSAGMLCTQCGHTNLAGSHFCSACGWSLDVSPVRSDETGLWPVTSADLGDEEQVLPGGDLPVGHGVLVVRRGPNAGSRFVLEGRTVTAGRSPDCDIFLDDVTVSRLHASFLPTGTSYAVRDDGSLNGTYLNRERIEQAPLANGDEVQVGKFRLVFLTGAAG